MKLMQNSEAALLSGRFLKCKWTHFLWYPLLSLPHGTFSVHITSLALSSSALALCSLSCREAVVISCFFTRSKCNGVTSFCLNGCQCQIVQLYAKVTFCFFCCDVALFYHCDAYFVHVLAQSTDICVPVYVAQINHVENWVNKWPKHVVSRDRKSVV